LHNVGKLLATGNQNRNLRSSIAQTNLQLQNENLKSDVSPPQGVFMNSSVNPSAESSNSPASDQAQTSVQAATGPDTPPKAPTETASNGTTANRQQPIPPPSEPMQYRAIGLVRGRYSASDEQFTQGTLVATDGTEINAVLLGRIMSLVKNHLNLEQEHLWVVYPRTGQHDGKLHLQIVGVWEPEKLSSDLPATARPAPEDEQVRSEQFVHKELEHHSSEIEDGYFSIRGEVVYQSASDQHFVVKIKQAPRKDSDKPKYFKLNLQGDLAIKAVGQFWDLQARRQAESLVVEKGEAIAVLPSKPKLRKNKPRQDRYPSGKRNLNDTPRPVRKAGDSTPVQRPIPKAPTPKPIKRQQPPQSESRGS
jgi:hypothetical protein